MPRDRILVTGISGRLGRLVARRLHRDYRVVGLDPRPFPERPKDVELHSIDLRRRKAEELFRKQPLAAVVHLGLERDPRMPRRERRAYNVFGTAKLLENITRYGVPKLVHLSSAHVYGPRPTNEGFLVEDAPLMATPRGDEVRDLITIDMNVQSLFWKHPEIDVVVLRPVPIVGPHMRNTPTRYLRMRFPPTILGYDPLVQFIHEQDVVEGIALALKPGVRGVFNLVGPGELPLSVVLREAGASRVPLPYPVAARLADRLHLPFAVDYLRYPCNADGARAREVLGFAPAWTLRETIHSALEPARGG